MERSAEGVLLETGRLVLRQFTMFDVDNLVTLDADPDVMRFITAYWKRQACTSSGSFTSPGPTGSMVAS